MSAVTPDLFADEAEASPEQELSAMSPPESALLALDKVLRQGYACQLGWSAGKDSSAVANLLLTAAMNLVKEGVECPPILITHSDTGIENPTARALAEAEIKKLEKFAAVHKIPMQVRIARPTLAASFATRVIGGRALPSFPDLPRRDCSVDLKVLPQRRLLREFRDEQKLSSRQVVTITGVRSDESVTRGIKTAERKETAHELWFSDDGEPRLSPILRWSADDVWTYLGESAAGLWPSYSDFSATLDFYRDAGNSSCAVVADMKMATKGKGCGARSGCAFCVQVKSDASAENMLESGKHPYLKPLLDLRDYIAKSQYNWNKRNYLGRTISPEGRLKVQADQYSPAECERLLRYTLAAQDRAHELGSPTRFQAIGIRELVAIDFFWSLRCWHPPFHALWVYLDHLGGNRKYAPQITAVYPPSPAPFIGEIEVGPDWDQAWSRLYPAGLRHTSWETFSESCGPGLRANAAGKVFLDLDESPELDVDAEGAEDFLSFIAEEKIESMHRHDYPDWTAGAMTYLQYGTVTLASGSSSMVDSMMRRSQWLQQHGLHGQQTAEGLRSRCVQAAAQQADMFA